MANLQGADVAKVHSFRFTPAGKAERQQQVHEANIRLVHDPEGRLRLTLWIKTTRPGETSDDRGVAGWDAPVIIAFASAPLDLPAGDFGAITVADALPADYWGERFLYYWDHEDFAQASMTIAGTGDCRDITLEARCTAGNAVAFEASFSE